jgi:hypothetical protein
MISCLFTTAHIREQSVEEELKIPRSIVDAGLGHQPISDLKLPWEHSDVGRHLYLCGSGLGGHTWEAPHPEGEKQNQPFQPAATGYCWSRRRDRLRGSEPAWSDGKNEASESRDLAGAAPMGALLRLAREQCSLREVRGTKP